MKGLRLLGALTRSDFEAKIVVSVQVALKPPAETALLAAVSTEKHGDALYFWAQLESKNSQPTDDFWSACDFANGGNCRHVVHSFLPLFVIKINQSFVEV